LAAPGHHVAAQGGGARVHPPRPVRRTPRPGVRPGFRGGVAREPAGVQRPGRLPPGRRRRGPPAGPARVAGRPRRRPAPRPAPGDYGKQQGKAFPLLLSRETKAAFDLRSEPEAVRARYGPGINAMSMLLARRLVEAGVPFVTVFWKGDKELDTLCKSGGGW